MLSHVSHLALRSSLSNDLRSVRLGCRVIVGAVIDTILINGIDVGSKPWLCDVVAVELVCIWISR